MEIAAKHVVEKNGVENPGERLKALHIPAYQFLRHASNLVRLVRALHLREYRSSPRSS